MKQRLLLILLLAFVPALWASAQSDTLAVFASNIDADEEVVGDFLLTPAYPNPFNPRTQFSLSVAEPQEVLIEVYNLLGRRVDVLHDGPLSGQTRYTFLFDADALPSGLYLIRVVGEQFTTTQRVTLLK